MTSLTLHMEKCLRKQREITFQLEKLYEERLYMETRCSNATNTIQQMQHWLQELQTKVVPLLSKEEEPMTVLAQRQKERQEIRRMDDGTSKQQRNPPYRTTSMKQKTLRLTRSKSNELLSEMKVNTTPKQQQRRQITRSKSNEIMSSNHNNNSSTTTAMTSTTSMSSSPIIQQQNTTVMKSILNISNGTKSSLEEDDSINSQEEGELSFGSNHMTNNNNNAEALMIL